MAGFVHILPKIGLKQPSIFFRVYECAWRHLFVYNERTWRQYEYHFQKLVFKNLHSQAPKTPLLCKEIEILIPFNIWSAYELCWKYTWLYG